MTRRSCAIAGPSRKPVATPAQALDLLAAAIAGMLAAAIAGIWDQYPGTPLATVLSALETLRDALGEGEVAS